MRRSKALLTAALVLASAATFNASSDAQGVPPSTATATPDNAVLLTVFFKHDQSRPLSELNAQLEKQGFYKAFPPAGVEVVSWYVMMGIGQVVTLRLPRTPPGVPTAPSSIRPMTTRPSASPPMRRRRNRA
jgi:hypothetical protein